MIRQYQNQGESAFEKRYTTYEAEDKLKVLEYMNLQGTSLRKTAAVFNIATPSTLLLWQKQYEAEGVDALKPKKKGRPTMKKKPSLEGLKAKNERLRVENAYLNKLKPLVQERESSG